MQLDFDLYRIPFISFFLHPTLLYSTYSVSEINQSSKQEKYNVSLYIRLFEAEAVESKGKRR